METQQNNIQNNAVENKQQNIEFVEIYEDRNKRAEKAHKALDLLQYVIETGLPTGPITIEPVPHRNGVGAGIRITGFKNGGEIFLSQEDISGMKMNSNTCAVGRWGVEEINKIPSQCAFGWKPGAAIDANGNEIKTFVRKESF